MKRYKLLLIALLIIGCEELGLNKEPEDSTNHIGCNPDLVCGQVVTCCDGHLYPTACCDANCDKEIGICN